MVDCPTASSLYISHDIIVLFDSLPSITRRALERLAEPLVARTISICERVLSDSRIRPSEVNYVVPVGGMTLMPLVRRRIEERFGAQMVAAGIDPATAVVRGAAIFAASQPPHVAAPVGRSASPPDR